MSALKSMERPIRNHVGGSVAKANTSATTEESVVGKKVETSNKAVPGRPGPAPLRERGPVASSARSEPPMDVDAGELLPTIPPAGKTANAETETPLALDDMDLEDETATLMFRRPEPPGPPRKPPPPKVKPAVPPAKPAARPPLPAPTHAAPLTASAKAPAKPAPPPPKPVAKPPAPKAPEPRADKPFLSVPTPAEMASPELKLSERPLFEVTLGSEKPLFATPEAGEISLLAPRAPNMPLLAAPLASDVASLDLRPKGGGGAPMLALPMLDFSRDVARHSPSSHPALGAKVVDLARAHGKWLVMVGGTVLIAGASWMVFHAAAAGSDATATASSRTAMPGAHTLATSPAARPTAPANPGATAQPVPIANSEPAAQPNEPSATEKAATAEPPAAATPPPVEHTAPAEVAQRPGAPAHTEAPAEAPAPVERTERPAPASVAEPVARPAAARTTSTERSSRASEPSTELPAAKAAPEPVAPPPAAPVAPTVAGMDGTPDFDQNAAMAALRQAAESAKRCQTAEAPAGGVRIAVTFARSGSVSATQVEGGVAGTPLGDCIVAKFQNVHVPPFRGSVMTVRKTVMF
jgi:hypothetical protein